LVSLGQGYSDFGSRALRCSKALHAGLPATGQHPRRTTQKVSITLLRCATLLWLRFRLKEASRISVYISCLHACLLITGPPQLQPSYRPFASGTASPAVIELSFWNNAELVVSSPGAIARCFRSRTWRCQVHSNPRSLLTLSPQVQVILCLGGIIAC